MRSCQSFNCRDFGTGSWQSHLNSWRTDFWRLLHMALIPARAFALVVDADFQTRLLFESGEPDLIRPWWLASAYSR
jgi:hypothetical protein